MTAAVSLALLGGIEASSWASSITAAVALLGGRFPGSRAR
jgi:hypothetical protein